MSGLALEYLGRLSSLEVRKKEKGEAKPVQERVERLEASATAVLIERKLDRETCAELER